MHPKEIIKATRSIDLRGQMGLTEMGLCAGCLEFLCECNDGVIECKLSSCQTPVFGSSEYCRYHEGLDHALKEEVRFRSQA